MIASSKHLFSHLTFAKTKFSKNLFWLPEPAVEVASLHKTFEMTLVLLGG